MPVMAARSAAATAKSGSAVTARRKAISGPARVSGSLRPPVPRGRLMVGSDHPAVVLDRGPGGG